MPEQQERARACWLCMWVIGLCGIGVWVCGARQNVSSMSPPPGLAHVPPGVCVCVSGLVDGEGGCGTGSTGERGLGKAQG